MCNKKELRSKLAANQVFLDRSRWFRKSARSCHFEVNTKSQETENIYLHVKFEMLC